MFMNYNPKREETISVRNSTNDNLKGISVMGQFRAVFANAVRNFRFGAACPTPRASSGGRAIDAPPPFVLSFQLFEGEIPRILIFLSPLGCGEDCVNAG